MTCIILFSFLAFRSKHFVSNRRNIRIRGRFLYCGSDLDPPTKKDPDLATNLKCSRHRSTMHWGKTNDKRIKKYTLLRTSSSTGQRFMCKV
jgi:hypothetical protein